MVKTRMKDIIIQNAILDDYDDYYTIRCEESDIYWMGHKSKPDYDYLFNVFKERVAGKRFKVSGDKTIYMVKKESGVAIGFTMLSVTDVGIEIGISILKKYQGMGLGTIIIARIIEIARSYSNYLVARIRDDNIASQTVFTKNGFVRTTEYELKFFPKAGLIPFRKYVYRV